MGDCFLIADEVGLGKTKSAKAILFEMIRLKPEHDIHAIYIASSTALANQNMTEEFLCTKKKGNLIGNQESNYKELAGFQKANARKVLSIFHKGYVVEYYKKDYVGPGYLEESSCKRLSEYSNECQSKIPYIMSLSPTTSFFIPSVNIGYKVNEGYKGDEKERKKLHEDFSNCTKILEDFIKSKGKQKYEVDILYKELCLALKYELTIKEKKGTEECIEKCKEISEGVNQEKGKTNEGTFYIARRIRSNASAAMYKPELIILDEFQRYRSILEKSSNGYTIREMIDYLKWRYEKEDYAPKLLLLSATPYKYNIAAMEPIQWGYGKRDESDSYDAVSRKVEKPFEDYSALKKCLVELGACEKDVDFVARTERKMFCGSDKIDEEIKRIEIKGASDEQEKKYQENFFNPIVSFCYDELNNGINPNDMSVICSEIGDSPEFWRFNYGYSKRTIISNEAQKLLMPQTSIKDYSVYSNLGLQQISEHFFLDKELPRLWVPPVSSGETGKGKMLIFTTMQVSTRSVAYFVDQMTEESVKDNRCFDDKTVCANDENFRDFIDDIFQSSKNEGLSDAYSVMATFFNRPFVKRVIAGFAAKKNSPPQEYFGAVKNYCDEYKLKEVLQEYSFVLGKNCSVNSLLAAFKHEPASIIEWKMDGENIKKEYANISYSEMFVCDDNKAGSGKYYEEIDAKGEDNEHRTIKDLNEIRDQFNSPIYPMVLVSRNTGQEGFNLQYYGDKLMHWQKASSVSAFLQREGRLDRPGSLIFREKVWKWVIDNKQNNKISSYEDAKKIFDCEFKNNYKKCGISEDAFESNISPLWNFDNGDIKIKQILPIYEYGDNFEDFIKEIVAADQYTHFHDNKEELCPFLKGKKHQLSGNK